MCRRDPEADANEVDAEGVGVARWTVIWVVAILVLIALAIDGAAHCVRSGAGHIDPRDPDDLGQLRAIADTSTPLRAAIAAHRAVHGDVPAVLDVLVDEGLAYDDFVNDAWRGWRYHADDSGAFAISRKLSWDADIVYAEDSRGRGSWVFMPGDGTEDVPLSFGTTAP